MKDMRTCKANLVDSTLEFPARMATAASSHIAMLTQYDNYNTTESIARGC